MILKYLYYIFGLLVGMLHVSFFANFNFFGFEISIVMITLLALILSKSEKNAYQFALSSGIVIDIFSPTPFGLTTIIVLLLVLFYKMVLKAFFEKTSFVARISLMFVAVLFTFVLRYIFIHIFFEVGVIAFEPDLSVQMIFTIIGSGAINTVLLLVVLRIFSYIDAFVQNKVYQRSRYIS